MRQFFLLLLLVCAAVGSQSATAQKIIEKTANLTAGQRVFLNLKQASNIRIRTGVAGKMTMKATVSINSNRLNDALQIDLSSSRDELKITGDFDQEMLKKAQPGDCANTTGDRNMWHGQQVCEVITYEITLPADVALRVYTYSGNVDIAGFTNAIDAKSLSGFVDVAWPAGKGAELSLKTITGEVYTDQDIAFSTAQRKNPIVGYQLHGTLSGSGPLVKLESISNDVYFRKRK
jgi:DUF4097 and DUF4098 domain-containing protein YvlB